MTGVAFDFETSRCSGVTSRVAYAVTARGEVVQLEETGLLSAEEAFGEGGLARDEVWCHLRFRGSGMGGQAPIEARLGDHVLGPFQAYHVDHSDDGRLQLTGERNDDGKRWGLASVQDGEWQTLGAPPAAAIVLCPPELPRVAAFTVPTPAAALGIRSRLSPLAAPRLVLA